MEQKMIIKPLGTVSPYLKDNMNCPGYLIEYKDINILLDCGNGITKLLDFPEILNNLYVIITHYHKDHIGDLGSIQYASFVHHRLDELDNRIKIFLPEKDFAYNKLAIINNKESYANYYDINDGDILHIGNLAITFEDNKSHTIESFMVKIEDEKNSLVYTSDVGTTNFEELISFCKDVDLLICESSYLLKHNANSTTHLTAHTAGVLAKEAKVKELLLTHFWPKEDKQLYLEEAQEVFENTKMAEEGKVLILK